MGTGACERPSSYEGKALAKVFHSASSGAFFLVCDHLLRPCGYISPCLSSPEPPLPHLSLLITLLATQELLSSHSSAVALTLHTSFLPFASHPTTLFAQIAVPTPRCFYISLRMSHMAHFPHPTPRALERAKVLLTDGFWALARRLKCSIGDGLGHLVTIDLMSLGSASLVRV